MTGSCCRRAVALPAPSRGSGDQVSEEGRSRGGIVRLTPAAELPAPHRRLLLLLLLLLLRLPRLRLQLLLLRTRLQRSVLGLRNLRLSRLSLGRRLRLGLPLRRRLLLLGLMHLLLHRRVDLPSRRRRRRRDLPSRLPPHANGQGKWMLRRAVVAHTWLSIWCCCSCGGPPIMAAAPPWSWPPPCA